MGGPTGLDYAGVCTHLDELGLVGDERRDIYAGLRAAERASLEAWAEKAKHEKQHQPGAPR